MTQENNNLTMNTPDFPLISQRQMHNGRVNYPKKRILEILLNSGPRLPRYSLAQLSGPVDLVKMNYYTKGTQQTLSLLNMIDRTVRSVFPCV